MNTDGYIETSNFVPREALRFEIHLADHCNLNCINCSHYSPLVKGERFLDVSQYEKDCTRLSELSGGRMERIRLMGGEPLLHPELVRIMEISRCLFPVGQIMIVSNGILLSGMKPEFWESCERNAVDIYITAYPIGDGKDPMHFRKNKVKIEKYSDTDRVRMRRNLIRIRGGKDPESNFRSCILANNCIQLRNGRLYTCPTAAYIPYLADYFDADIPSSEGNSVDIYSAGSLHELYKGLSKPIPLCQFCCCEDWSTYGDDWRVSERDRYEWIAFTFNDEDVRYLKACDRVYVYGAGEWGGRTVTWMQDRGIRIEAVVVSDRADNPSELGGVRVTTVDDVLFSRNDLCLIAVCGEEKIGIQHRLVEKGVKRIIPLMNV